MYSSTPGGGILQRVASSKIQRIFLSAARKQGCLWTTRALALQGWERLSLQFCTEEEEKATLGSSTEGKQECRQIGRTILRDSTKAWKPRASLMFSWKSWFHKKSFTHKRKGAPRNLTKRWANFRPPGLALAPFPKGGAFFRTLRSVPHQTRLSAFWTQPEAGDERYVRPVQNTGEMVPKTFRPFPNPIFLSPSSIHLLRPSSSLLTSTCLLLLHKKVSPNFKTSGGGDEFGSLPSQPARERTLAAAILLILSFQGIDGPKILEGRR